MKRLLKLVISSMLSLVCLFSLFGCSDPNTGGGGGGGGQTPSNKPFVTKVEIISNPNKLDYIEGEVFSATGLKFTATWNIKGKTRQVKHSHSVCDWTHKGEPLTTSVNKITFTIKQTNFSFDVPVRVSDLSATGISISKGNLKANYVEGDYIDLTQITVSMQAGSSFQPLTPGSYKLFDNNQEITISNSYRLTAGQHTFKATFQEKEAEFTIKAWALSELTVDEFTVSNTAFGNNLFPGQTIDLTKIKVEQKLVSSDQSISVTRAITDYTLKDGNTVIPAQDRGAYVLTAGTHVFTVEYGTYSKTFTLTTADYDTLTISKKTDGNTVGQNTTFYANYAVYMAKSLDPSQKMTINKGDYEITAKRGGIAVDNVTEENVFSIVGEVEITITYRGLSKKITVTVEGALIINTTNMVFTKDLPMDGANIRRNADGVVVDENGQPFKTKVYGAPDYYEIGKNFLEVPANNGQYADRTGWHDDPAHIGEIKAGQKLIFHIWSDKAQATEVDVVIYAASMNFRDIEDYDSSHYPNDQSVASWQPTVTLDVQFNRVISTTYNNGSGEQAFNIGNDVIVPGYTSQITEPNGQGHDTLGRYYDPKIWTAWSPVVLGSITLNQGDNTITLTVNVNQMNFGMLEIRFK